MTASGSAEFTLNLISNASMETFPGNKLSSFTTLLPTPVTFSGDWQVALLEISWPALVRNITEGQITVSKIVPRPKSPPPHQSPSKNIPSRRPGVVSMRVPRQFRAVKPALTFTAPEVRYIKPGCYSSVDDVMDAIVRSATRNDNEKLLPPTTQHPTDATWRSTNISWKVDKVTQELHVKFWGNVEQNGLVIRAKSQDLKNILGLTTVIDCQHGEHRQESKKNFDGNCQDEQQIQRDIAVVKNSGQWPVDLKAGSPTIFLYCDLVQNEILGDTQTALLRSIPLESLSWTDHRKTKEVNHRSFSNLQWKRIYKSQFQSITLTLANEMGQRMPFLSCGRTSITLALRTKPC